MIPTGAVIPEAMSITGWALGASLGPLGGCAVVAGLVALGVLVVATLREPHERGRATHIGVVREPDRAPTARRPAA